MSFEKNLNKYSHLGRLFVIMKVLMDQSEKFSRNPPQAYLSATVLLKKVNDKLKIQDLDSVSERTLMRDISELRKPPFNATIESSSKGYYLVESSGEDGLNPMTLLEPFQLLNSVYMLTGLEKMLIPQPFSEKGTEYLYPILKSIKKRGCIHINYRKHSGEDKDRKLFPIALKQFGKIWFLIATDGKREELKTYGLDRITDLKLLPGSLTASKFKIFLESIPSKFSASFGIYSDEKYDIEQVILEVEDEDAAYLCSNPLHHSQKLRKKMNGHNSIELEIRITEDFKMALMSRAWSLTVVEPKWLRKEMTTIFEKAANRNQGNEH